MATTYDISTDAGAVRLGIGDTGSGDAWVFDDAEIAYFLTKGGTVKGAQIEALRALLTAKSYRVKRAAANGVSYDDTAQLAGIKQALSLLGGDMPTATVTKTGPYPWEAKHFAEGGL